MKKPGFISIAFILVVLVPVVACATGIDENHTPIPTADMYSQQPEQEAPDDIVSVPGAGGAYRANVHQEDVENPWPPVETIETVLGSSTDNVTVWYREYIETKAGERRNNIINVRKEGGLFENRLSLYSMDVPDGIELECDRQVGLPGTLGRVLVIEIAPDVAPGEYAFEIGIEVDGKDYGTVSRDIEVIKETYQGNHGITTTKIERSAGDSGISISGLMVRLTLNDLVKKSDSVIIGKVVDIFPSRQVDWEPWDTMIITDVVIEVERSPYSHSHSPYVAVTVRGGRVGDMGMWVEDEAIFNLGEEVVLFLYQMESDITPPEGFDSAVYFRVTGGRQGKLGYGGSQAIAHIISEIEQKIAEIYGAQEEV